jgi:V8-like Glu-specific endopeptidase
MNPAGNINIHDNTIYNSSYAQLYIAHWGATDSVPMNNRFFHNIFVAKYKVNSYWQQTLQFAFSGTGNDNVYALASSVLDSNYYARPASDGYHIKFNTNPSYTVAQWQAYSGKDVHSHESPKSVSSVDSIQFVYNPTTSISTVTLSRPMEDMMGNKYNSSITLAPFTSSVLIVDNGTITDPLTGADIATFTLPGQIGNTSINATSKTIGITLPYGTSVTNLAAKFTLSTGAMAKVGTTAQVSGSTVNSFANPVVYAVTAQDGTTTKNWTVTVTVASNNQSDITAFTLPGQVGSSVINSSSQTIGITMPYGTSVTNLAANFTLSTGATAKVGTTAQVSGSTVNSFANPVVYAVTAQDGTTTKNWTVTVTVASNNQSDITAFTLPGQVGSSVINSSSQTIGITMPYGTSVTNLAANFTLSTGATAKVGTTAQVSGSTVNSFANPVVYAVTAQDGTTTKNWTVTVTVASNNQSDITAFTLPGQVGSSVINSSSKTIGITMPYGSSLTSLVAEFTISDGAIAKVGTMEQVSGMTTNSFINPVIYDVTAQDGITTTEWTVTVTIAAGVPTESEQVINLKAGWNIVAFNVVPSSTDFNVIFQPLIQSGVLIKVQDEQGNFMVNTDYGWYSNLGPLDTREGYNVKVTANAQLIVKGQPVSTNNDIPLSDGFNIIGYPLTKSHDALSSFQSLTNEGSLVKVQDETGNFILKNGSNWFSSIDSLEPGKGYYVNVNKNTSISFGSLKSGMVAVANETSQSGAYFQKSFSGNPYSSMNFVLRNLSKSNLNLTSGDEIGIFDGNACVGNFVYDGLDITGVSAGMKDQSSSINGFTPGDTIKFQIWKPADQVLIKNITAVFLNNSSGVYTSQGTALVELQAQLATLEPVIKKEALEIRNYPNPFVDNTTFEFTLSENTKVTLEIFDMLGKMIKEITNQEYELGVNTVMWDGTNQNGQKVNPGMYIYYFKAGNHISSNKIIYGSF